MKLIGPRLRITKRGVRLIKPRVRVGGRRAGINVSGSGVSGSVGGNGWSYNTKRGLTLGTSGKKKPRKGCLGCGGSALVVVLAAAGAALVGWGMFR